MITPAITTQHTSPAFLEGYPQMVEAAGTERAGVIVGGQGLTVELQHRLVPAAFGRRLAHLKEFARALVSSSTGPERMPRPTNTRTHPLERA